MTTGIADREEILAEFFAIAEKYNPAHEQIDVAQKSLGDFLNDQQFWEEMGEQTKAEMIPIFRALLQAGAEAGLEEIAGIISEGQKFNPSHDARGRFSSGGGGGGLSGFREVSDSEARQILDNMQRELPFGQADAIRGYISQGEHHAINRDLRTGRPLNELPEATRIKHLDQVINGSKIPDRIIVYRGVDRRLNLKKGQVVLDKGFLSASLSRREAENFASSGSAGMMRIGVPKGTKGYPGWPDEREIIFPRNTKLRIIAVHPNSMIDAVII